MRRRNKKGRLLIILGAAHSLNHSLFLIAPPLLAVIIKDLGISNFTVGTIGTAASFIYGGGALIGGALGDRIGETKTIILSLFFSGISTFLMVFGGTLFIYVLAMVLIAVWASLYHPASNSFIMKVFGTAEAMGWHGLGGNLGFMLTPTIAWSIGSSFGWQSTFMLFGILCVTLALLYVKLTKMPPTTSDSKINVKALLTIFKHDALRKILLFNISIGLFSRGLEYFLPTYLIEVKQIDPLWASIAFTLILATGVPAQLFGGRIADAFGYKKVLIATSLGGVFSLFALQLLPLPILQVTLFIILYGVSINAHQPALSTLTGLLCPEQLMSTNFGLFYFTFFGVGSLSQSISGYFADNYGLESTFHLLTLFAVITLFISTRIPTKKGSITSRSEY